MYRFPAIVWDDLPKPKQHSTNLSENLIAELSCFISIQRDFAKSKIIEQGVSLALALFFSRAAAKTRTGVHQKICDIEISKRTAHVGFGAMRKRVNCPDLKK